MSQFSPTVTKGFREKGVVALLGGGGPFSLSHPPRRACVPELERGPLFSLHFNRLRTCRAVFVSLVVQSLSFHVHSAKGVTVAVQFLLYIMTLLLFLIFWELSKIHTRIKKALSAAASNAVSASGASEGTFRPSKQAQNV